MGGVVYGADGSFRLLKLFQDDFTRVIADPVRHQAIDFVGVLGPGRGSGIPGVIGQLVSTDELHDPPCDGRRGRG